MNGNGIDYDQFELHVKRFNETFKAIHNPELRGMLVVEEAAELWKAVIKGKSDEEVRGEWGDLMYVAIGWALVAKIDIPRALYEVCRKNQVKIDNAATYKVSDSGKVLKPEDIQAAKDATLDHIRDSLHREEEEC
jgi:NTP pyrophosphatase (non-canonical NTP hydrolase)